MFRTKIQSIFWKIAVIQSCYLQVNTLAPTWVRPCIQPRRPNRPTMTNLSLSQSASFTLKTSGMAIYHPENGFPPIIDPYVELTGIRSKQNFVPRGVIMGQEAVQLKESGSHQCVFNFFVSFLLIFFHFRQQLFFSFSLLNLFLFLINSNFCLFLFNLFFLLFSLFSFVLHVSFIFWVILTFMLFFSFLF